MADLNLGHTTTNTEESWNQGPSLLGSVWRFRYLVAAAALLAGLAGYGLSQLQEPTYESTARLYLLDPRSQGVFSDSRSFAEPTEYVPQQAERVTSGPVLQRASQLLAGTVPPGELEERVTTTPLPELLLVEITATADGAERAAEVANAMALAYQQVNEENALARANTAAQELEARRQAAQQPLLDAQAALQADPDNIALINRVEQLGEQLLDLQSTAERLALDAQVFGSGVDFYEPASAPSEPSAPAPARNAVLAAILGAALASAYAYWRAGRAHKADSPSDAAWVLGAPLLGEVPTYATKDRGSLPERLAVDPQVVEAYQFVLSSIDFALAEHGGTSVLLTSVAPGDGKTVTALQLSMAAARDGRRVVLVDADNRVRGLSKLLGTHQHVGLTQLATRDLEVDDCLRHVPVGGQMRLPVVAAGGKVEDATSFFRGAGFRKAMLRIRNQADLVLVDSPPVLAAADSSVIAGQVDGVVLVVNRGTPLAQLERVRERLEWVSKPLLGYVYNRSESSMTPYYGEMNDTPRRGRRRGREVEEEPLVAPYDGRDGRRRESQYLGFSDAHPEATG